MKKGGKCMSRTGDGTLIFDRPPFVRMYSSTVGKMEGEGPLGLSFDRIIQDDTLGEKSFEKAERRMLEETAQRCLQKAKLTPEEVDILLGGDLLNQIISVSFASRTLQIPVLGVYSACSSMSESILIAAALLSGGYAQRTLCCASSHFSASERQYRFPLELGNQRPPTSQRTVTGAGCLLLDSQKTGTVYVHSATIGKVVDFGVKDADQMGAAMAPAAADTIYRHMRNLQSCPEDYDLIVSGDLGKIGACLLRTLLKDKGILIDMNHFDCGASIFNHRQDVHAGGSGAGCCASVLCGHLLRKMEKGSYHRLLFVATGALLSPTTTLQGESIPSVAHAIEFVRED